MRKKGHDGKKTYQTLEAARAAAAKTASFHSKNGDPIVTYLRAYKCSTCGKFHFGASKKIDWSKVR